MSHNELSTDLGVALKAANVFLERAMDRSGNEKLRPLISAMLVMQDGYPIDPAIWDDWSSAAARVLSHSPTDLLPETAFEDAQSQVSFSILLEFLREASSWAIGSDYDELANKLEALIDSPIMCETDGVSFSDWRIILDVTKTDPESSQLVFRDYHPNKP